MFAPETTAFLEGGCSLIVGTVGGDGAPNASRAWGLTVLSRAEGECRLLLDIGASRFLADLAESSVIAVTAADVPTLHSIQMKGGVSGIEPASDTDRDRAAQYTDAFFGEIERTDGTDRAVLDRMRPHDYVVCSVRFVELYDQTPGPVAGAPIDESVR